MVACKTEKMSSYVYDWKFYNPKQCFYLCERLDFYGTIYASIADNNIVFGFGLLKPPYKRYIVIVSSFIALPKNEKTFDTLEEAKSFADDLIANAGYKTLPKKLEILL
jgi:hypothetical protein